MTKHHMKRHAAPGSWPILRKVTTFITRPNPGSHKFDLGLPISIVLRDILKQCKTTREVKKILQHSEVLIDGKRIKDHRMLVGFMDVISIPGLKKNYRISINKKGKLQLIEIDDKEKTLKLSKITGKSLVKGKTQLNCIDGRNILVDKDGYNVGDVLLLELPSQKIKDKVTLEKKKTKVMLLGGKHIGEVESVEDFTGKKITLRTESGEVYETLRKYAFAVGTDKPIIKVTTK